MKTRKIFSIILAGIIVGLYGEAYAATRYVTVEGAGTKSGIDWANASDNIQDMINASVAGDQVWIAGGTYLLSITLNTKAGVDVYGGFAGTETSPAQRERDNSLVEWDFSHPTVLDGRSAIQVLFLRWNPDDADISTVCDGLTIANGQAYTYSGVYIGKNYRLINSIVKDNSTVSGTYGEGGGVYIANGGLISNCLVTGNMVYSTHNMNGAKGGGIYNNGGIVMDCEISYNRAEVKLASMASAEAAGGGIYNDYNSTVIRCKVTYNQTWASAASGSFMARGGGIACRDNTSSIVSDCAVENNTTVMSNNTGSYLTRGEGGGIYQGKVTNCIVRGNQSGNGGGLFGGNNGCVVDKCRIQNNTAYENGGGLFGGNAGCFASNCLIHNNIAHTNGGGGYASETANCTIVRNRAPNGKGGALYEAVAVNCIIWDNTSLHPIEDGQCWWTTLSYSAIQYLNVQPYNGNISISDENDREVMGHLAPYFVDPSYDVGDFRLSPNSPCIGKGSKSEVASYGMTSDLDGNPRTYGRKIDMGAYERIKTIEEPIVGCMDTAALSYNPVATVNDDNACIYEVTGQPLCGCNDPEALNFNPLVTEYDGSCVYATVENTYNEPITETPVDTVGVRPLEDCQLDIDALISLAYIAGIEITGENQVMIQWIIEQMNGNTISYIVDYLVNNSGFNLFYLSIICKDGDILRATKANADVRGYTVSALYHVDLATDISRPKKEINGLAVFPNPFTDELTILVKEAKTVDIVLYSAEGKALANYSNLNEVQMGTSKLPAGFYVVKVTADGKTQSVTVVKK